MIDLRRFFACALGACLCAYPASVAAQHASEPKATEHAAPAAKHEPAAEPAKAVEAKTKEAGKPVAKSEPAKKTTGEHEAPARAETAVKPSAKAETAAKPEAASKAETAAASTHEKGGKPEAEKTASAGHGAKAEPKDKAAEPKEAKSAKADGPRVTVTRVDEATGTARGAARPAASSKLEAALGRISERIDDGRKESARAPAKSANRIQLTWRSTLDWPEELGAAAPEPQMPEPPAAHEPPPDKDHVALVWE